MTKKEAVAYLKKNDIQFILAQFVDIHGVAKTKSVPVGHLEMILTDGAGFAGFAIWGYGMGPDGPDLMYRGDLKTLVKMDWMPGYARIVCDGYVDDQPYEYGSRVVCKNAIKKLKKKTGMTLFSGLEPEFYLLKIDPVTGKPTPAYDSDVLEKPCYDYQGLFDASDFITDLTSCVIESGLDVYQIDHEDANGQFEINFTYSDAVTSSDRYILFKMAASSIAKHHGFLASFMPKPFSNKTGNGMHMHLSLGNSNVSNAFADDKDKRHLGLSKLAYQFMAGVLKHSRALSAIACPTVNSYKRLVVGGVDSGSTWAPAFICYGDNNRTASVRVPYGHLEVRNIDSAANPYLVTAAIIAAGLDGIENDLDPGEPNNINLYETSPAQRKKLGIKQLPQSLTEALDCLEKDTVIKAALGENLAKCFIEIKREEALSYARHVSDWEVKRYLTFY